MTGEQENEEETETCSACEGSGREAGHFGLSRIPCWHCKGTGQEKRRDNR
jgi:DnaJ-class molecular chaperone